NCLNRPKPCNDGMISRLAKGDEQCFCVAQVFRRPCLRWVKTRIPPFWAYVSFFRQLPTLDCQCFRRCVPILLQKSFCTGDQKFSEPYTRRSCKDVGDLIA